MTTLRKRTTWSQSASRTPRAAATSRRADPYSMNQEHPQPTPIQYENGNPDTWAETPSKNQLVYDGYDGDHESRNDLNFAEFKPETFDHKDSKQWHGPGKYDNSKVSSAVRKAGAAERVARATLRTTDEKMVESQALDLMSLPDKVLIATLKRLDAVSPNSLPRDRKYKRAMACCKFAHDFLGSSATEKGVEKLGAALMGVDDPTLKNIFKVATIARISGTDKDDTKDDTDKDDTDKDDTDKDDTDKDATTAAGSPETKVEFHWDEDHEGDDDDHTGCLAPQDMAMLDSLLQQDGTQEGPPQTGELTELFNAPAQSRETDISVLPVPGDGPEITFGDEEEPRRTASSNANAASQLSMLFDDHPEVVAQREIQSAAVEQRAREGGFNQNASIRTASSGAKKLGNVRGRKPRSGDDELAGIWGSPTDF